MRSAAAAACCRSAFTRLSLRAGPYIRKSAVMNATKSPVVRRFAGDLLAADPQRRRERHAADDLHQRRQHRQHARHPHARAIEALGRLLELRRLARLGAERLDDAMAGQRFGADVGHLFLRFLRAPRGAPHALPQAHERIDDERRAGEADDRQPRVVVEQHGDDSRPASAIRAPDRRSCPTPPAAPAPRRWSGATSDGRSSASLKKAADCPSMCRKTTLRRSRTTRCPTSVIRYDERYAPMPLSDVDDEDGDDRRDQTLACGQHAVEDRLDQGGEHTPTRRRRAPSPPARPPVAPDVVAHTRRGGGARSPGHPTRTIAQGRSPNPCGWALCQRQASRTIVSRSARFGVQPRSWRIRCADAYSTAGSPGRRGADRRVNGSPGDPLDGGDHILHRRGTLGADVVGRGRSALLQPGQRANMRVGQIGHVDVVAQAGAVGRRIVLAEDVDRTARRDAASKRARDDVDLRRMILAELAVRDRRRRR